MERHFVLPIVFAAAAHGALLFGFTKTPRAAVPVSEKSICRLPMHVAPPPPEEIIVEPEASAASAASKPILDAPPRTPEPAAELQPMDVPTMPRPPVTPFDRGEITVIPKEAFARPGDGDGPNFGPGGIVPTAFLDNTPRTRFQASPVFPYEAKAQGLHGEVVVEFIVGPDGRVRDPHVVRSSNRVFDEASLRAVSKWVFEPGRRHGRVVAFKMAVPLVFTLTE